MPASLRRLDEAYTLLAYILGTLLYNSYVYSANSPLKHGVPRPTTTHE